MLKLLLASVSCLTLFFGHSLALCAIMPVEEPALQLTTEVIRQRYCEGDAELYRLDFELKLRYQNIGSQPIVLYKGSEPVYQVMVSRSPADAAANKYEINSSLSYYTDGSPWNVSESSLSRLFVILPRRGVYETKTVAGVFVMREGISGRIEGSVGGGEHYLQVRIPTWYGSQDAADRLQRKWRGSGLLWTKAVTSSPMKFMVESQRTVADCE